MAKENVALSGRFGMEFTTALVKYRARAIRLMRGPKRCSYGAGGYHASLEGGAYGGSGTAGRSSSPDPLGKSRLVLTDADVCVLRRSASVGE